MIHMTKVVGIKFLEVETYIVNCELIWSSSSLLCYLVMIMCVAINCMYDILVNFFLRFMHKLQLFATFVCQKNLIATTQWFH